MTQNSTYPVELFLFFLYSFDRGPSIGCAHAMYYFRHC